MKTIPFKIEMNPTRTFAIVENPESNILGLSSYDGHKVIRSPFATEKEARERAHRIAKANGYQLEEINQLFIHLMEVTP